MRKLTLEYLRGIVDALYHTQTELLGSEIEDEKNFDMNAYLSGNGFEVRLTSTIGLKDAKFENDDHIPINSTQVIYVHTDTKVSKVIKDIIVEMESIYEQPTPELVEA